MIDSRFIWLAVALSAYGGANYVVATWRGKVSPNRVTWGLWAIEGLLAFGVELQSHVGASALTTMMLGVVPVVVVIASYRRRAGAWELGPFDLVCGVVALSGVLAWLVINQATLALVSFTAADTIAALPTLRKSWIAPQSEKPAPFLMGTLNCVITLLVLRHFTTSGALFPGSVLVVDAIIALAIMGNIGPRWRERT